MNRISEFVAAEDVIFRLGAQGGAGVLDELSAALALRARLERTTVRTALAEREVLGSTALGHGIAVPHAKLDVPRVLGVLGLAPDGIAFGAADGEPSRIFIALVSPLQGGAHLKALAAIARELGDPDLRAKLLAARDAAEVHRVLWGRS